MEENEEIYIGVVDGDIHTGRQWCSEEELVKDELLPGERILHLVFERFSRTSDTKRVVRGIEIQDKKVTYW